ncbi:uncharacterized protein LOC116852480 [Odontomachus brunneus]|uniref:uncharacterized protein LOC116852480 n=1 Tax=Odontomachus brunneus TaxID=486640 RepID=UPI0013F24F75|nr:uncharacterized protein LOC116852480 [Odontomachus brunneus]
MRRARENIDLGTIGIGEIRTRNAATAALVLGILGPEGHARVDASKMSALFAKKEDVRIARPVKKADIRLRNLDDATTVEDVVSVVAVVWGCGLGDSKAGVIRTGTGRMGTLWIQCPLTAARKLLDARHLKAGCPPSSVRVEALTKRPIQCFKCLEWDMSESPVEVRPTAVVFVTTAVRPTTGPPRATHR